MFKEGGENCFNPGASAFEVNYRTIIAIWEKKRFTALTNFCGFMNLPLAINVKPFDDMQDKVASTYTYVNNVSMENAANEFIDAKGDFVEDKVSYITVSNDRSW